MSELTWKYEELVRATRSKEPEVRYWAVDRLVRHFPVECCDAIADFLLDDHDVTPAAVARHLGEHGGPQHHEILVRGFRVLRGLTPGYCLQALVMLGHAEAVDLASDALKRGDLTEPALAIIVEALAKHGTPQAHEVVREYVARKVEILAEAGEAFRTIMDTLRIDDASWCLRTGPSGRIELRKTIKAVESGYDCDIFSTMGEATIKQIAQRFRAGNLTDITRSIADWTVGATAKLDVAAGNDLSERVAAAVGAFSSPAMLAELERMGNQFQHWVLGFQLSAAFAVARKQNREMTLDQVRGDLPLLLNLAEVETAFNLNDLPSAIAKACGDDEQQARRAQEWCLRMLEAQGPFFPKVVALETLGELGAVHFIPEMMEYLSEENSYIYGAAERSLAKMGESVVAPAVARIESGAVDPDAAHSLLVLLCDLGTRAGYDAVVRHLDWFMHAVGPGTTAEWVSLFGTEELIEPLRDWLEEDPALVGQGLLLLGAIHDVEIPEEEDILRAIEDERARQAEAQGGGSLDGIDSEDGDYVM